MNMSTVIMAMGKAVAAMESMVTNMAMGKAAAVMRSMAMVMERAAAVMVTMTIIMRTRYSQAGGWRMQVPVTERSWRRRSESFWRIPRLTTTVF